MGNRALPGGPPLQGAHPLPPKHYNNINNIKDSTNCPGAQCGASPPPPAHSYVLSDTVGLFLGPHAHAQEVWSEVAGGA